MKPKLNILVVMDQNGVLGTSDSCLWRKDKEITDRYNRILDGYPILVDDRGWRELYPRPMEKRKNLIVSSDFHSSTSRFKETFDDYSGEIFIYKDWDMFLGYLPKIDSTNVFLLGSEEAFSFFMGLDLIDCVYCFVIKHSYKNIDNPVFPLGEFDKFANKKVVYENNRFRLYRINRIA